MSNWGPVARTRAYRSRWLWIPAVAISATAQGTAIITYAVTRPIPKPSLTIRLDDAASGEIGAAMPLSLDTRIGRWWFPGVWELAVLGAMRGGCGAEKSVASGCAGKVYWVGASLDVPFGPDGRT